MLTLWEPLQYSPTTRNTFPNTWKPFLSMQGDPGHKRRNWNSAIKKILQKTHSRIRVQMSGTQQAISNSNYGAECFPNELTRASNFTQSLFTFARFTHARRHTHRSGARRPVTAHSPGHVARRRFPSVMLKVPRNGFISIEEAFEKTAREKDTTPTWTMFQVRFRDYGFTYSQIVYTKHESRIRNLSFPFSVHKYPCKKITTETPVRE